MLSGMKLYQKLEKRSFLTHEIYFLGFIVLGDRIKVDPSKVRIFSLNPYQLS